MSRLKPILPYVAVLSVLFLSRIFGLDSFVTIDEAAWFNRSANFYYALGQREFFETFLDSSVGVVTMWVNTFAILLVFPMYRGLGQGYLAPTDEKWATIFSENNISELAVLSKGRVLMVFVLIIGGMFIFWYLKRLLGTFPALIGFLMLALDPFYIALSRTTHLDAPMGTFLILSILAYHAYLTADGKTIDLAISGGAGALSLLGKTTGLLTIPGIIGVSALSLLSAFGRRTFSLGEKVRHQLKMHFKNFAIWILLFLVVFIIIWPAMWVKPLQTMEYVVTHPLRFVDLELESYEPDTAQISETSGIFQIIEGTLNTFRAYITTFLWRTSPAVLIGILLLLVGYWFRWGLLDKETARSLVRNLVFVAIYFTLIMSVGDKFSEKYIIPVYLALDIAAGIGWVAAVGLVSESLRMNYRGVVTVALVLLPVAFQAVLVWDYYPYYFSYYNPLLGGSEKAGLVRFVGVGEGLDRAADFLNQLPDAENLRVLSWYGRGPFSYFFDGETVTIPTRVWGEHFIDSLQSSDYLVVYTNQWYRLIPPELFEILADVKPVHRVWIEDIEYARIYNVDDIPLE